MLHPTINSEGGDQGIGRPDRALEQSTVHIFHFGELIKYYIFVVFGPFVHTQI